MGRNVEESEESGNSPLFSFKCEAICKLIYFVWRHYLAYVIYKKIMVIRADASAKLKSIAKWVPR